MKGIFCLPPVSLRGAKFDTQRAGKNANRHKPSGIAAQESILKWHLVPALGAKRLDTITNERVDKLKLALVDLSSKDLNNVLTVLSTSPEEGRGVGRARLITVHDQGVTQSEEDDGFSRLRTIRAIVSVAKSGVPGMPT